MKVLSILCLVTILASGCVQARSLGSWDQPFPQLERISYHHCYALKDFDTYDPNRDYDTICVAISEEDYERIVVRYGQAACKAAGGSEDICIPTD